MNPWLILGPIGMIAVGVVSIAWWKTRSHSPWRPFLLGGFVWFAAIIPKFILDLTVTTPLYFSLLPSIGLVGALAAVGVYLGLRTGVLECGFTFLGVSRTRLREASLDEATAFGVGFGATEAILLGIEALINIAVFLVSPSIIDSLPPDQASAILASLNASTLTVPAPIMERFFAMIAHVLASLLIFYSVRFGRRSLFALSFIYKTALDSPILFFQSTIASSNSILTLYLVELWVVIFGIVGLLGTIRLRRSWNRRIVPTVPEETES